MVAEADQIGKVYYKKEVPQLIFSGSKLMLEQVGSSNNKSLSQVNLYYEVRGGFRS